MRKLLDYQEISSIWNNQFVLQGTSVIIKNIKTKRGKFF